MFERSRHGANHRHKQLGATGSGLHTDPGTRAGFGTLTGPCDPGPVDPAAVRVTAGRGVRVERRRHAVLPQQQVRALMVDGTRRLVCRRLTGSGCVLHLDMWTCEQTDGTDGRVGTCGRGAVVPAVCRFSPSPCRRSLSSSVESVSWGPSSVRPCPGLSPEPQVEAQKTIK